MSAHPIILDDNTEHRQQDVVFLAYSVSLPLASRLFPRALLTKSCFGWESVWCYLVVPCRQRPIHCQLRRRLLWKFVFAGQGAYSTLNLIRDATFPSRIRIMDVDYAASLRYYLLACVNLPKSWKHVGAGYSLPLLPMPSLTWWGGTPKHRFLIPVQWSYLIFLVAISHRSRYEQKNLIGHIVQ